MTQLLSKNMTILVTVAAILLFVLLGSSLAAVASGSGRDVEYEVQPPDPGGNLTESEEETDPTA